MTNTLAGKVVIVTGASSGIGAAAVRLLAEQGCKLTLAARSLDKMQALAEQLPAETLVLRADMTIPGDIESMVQRTLEHFGRIDVMWANAGIYIPGEFADGDPDAYSTLLKINVDAVLRCAHAVTPQMKAQGSGDILVTSSIAGHIDVHWEPVYSASKHAVETFVNTLRRQLAPFGIRVGSLAPGRVANELWGFSNLDDIERASVQERGYIKSEDVAEAAVFMLSRPPHVTLRSLVILPQNQDI